MDLTKLIFSIMETLWPLAMDLWEAWGIQLLVLVSCFFQIILLTLGGKRRYSFNVYSRFTIWAFYLLASYIATFTLGKLTVVKIRDPENSDYNVGLKGLLAPLLLVHLANPDCISAYSVEDNRLGVRQVLSLIVTIGFVIWVLIRCWDSSSSARWLYIPLFTAGVIKSVGTILALKSVYDDSTSVDEMKRYNAAITDPVASGFHRLILMAYHRFDSLRPHQVNWLYHPKYIENTWMSVDGLGSKDGFTVTEIELGFVFDLLYTKRPILYKKRGIVCKVIAFSCLISTLCGFSIIYRSAFLLDLYVTYTYALLMVSTIIELYQVCILPFSQWTIVKIYENQNKLVNEKLLACIAKTCEKQRRWSNSIHQLNMVEYCSKGDWCSLISLVLRLFRLEERLKRYRRSTYVPIPSNLKDVVWENMKSMSFRIETRGGWTLGRWEDRLKDQPYYSEHKMKIMKNTLKKELGKSIITWHIATDILLRMSNSPSTGGKHSCVSQLLSNYMMYLLVRHPYMLSLTTSDITFGYACSILKDFAQGQELPQVIKTLLGVDYEEEGKGKPKTFITERWRVLRDVKTIVYQLRNLESKWELISSIWVEMLCFSAYHCQVYHHAQRLRKGGELITHVWLLLAHKTDKFPSDEFEQDV